jgi:hypothetical protein
MLAWLNLHEQIGSEEGSRMNMCPRTLQSQRQKNLLTQNGSRRLKLSGLATVIVILVAGTSVGLGQGLRRAASLIQAPSSERRTSQLICTMSLLFSAEPGDRHLKRASLDGRGLLSCQNDQGFATEYPVRADMETSLPPASKSGPEQLAISADSSAFVIPREVFQLQDTYSVRGGIVSFATDIARPGREAKPTVLLRGQNHDLVIELGLKGRDQNLEGLKIMSLKLRFDNTAPDLL